MLGFIAAILAVFSWTFACSIWRSESEYILPKQINIYKNILASIIFLPVAFSINWISDAYSIFILMLSGIIGIGIGDTLYINSLKLIGTRKTLSFESITPVLASILGSFMIGEIYDPKAWLGCLLVSLSLFMIVRQNTNVKDNHTNTKAYGIMYALGSVFCAVLAALMSRMILISSSFSPIQTTEIRLLSASIFLFIIFKRDFFVLSRIRSISKRSHYKLISSTFLGTNCGILFQQIVFKFLPLGTGWILLSLSPILALFFSKKEGDIISKSTVIYSMLAFLGVALALT